MLTVGLVHFERGRAWSAPFPDLDSASTLVLLFGGRELEGDSVPFRALRAAYPRSALIGCSTAGEISGKLVVDDTLSVCVARFERTRLRRVQAQMEGAADSYAAGRRIGQELAAPDLRGVLVFCDGLAVNGSELARGLNETLPQGTVVTGGLAGDGSRFERTWTLDAAGLPRQGLVSAVGLAGPHVRLHHGSRGGWDVFGPRRRVTRSRGNVLYELDHTRALDLYKRYLGDRASGLPASALLFPLELRATPDAHSVVRTVLAIDEQSASMTFAGDVPEGHYAQLMRANFDRLIDGAAAAAGSLGQLPHDPGVCIAVSCVGRRLVLGERTDEEAEATLEALPPAVSQIGMYSYGELSPQGVLGCDLHNQTMTLTVIQEVA